MSKTAWQKIAITTGDLDGIGLEISAKALVELGPQPKSIFFLFRDSAADDFYLKKIDRKFERVVVDDLPQALEFFSLLEKERDLSTRILIDVASTEAPARWVESVARECKARNLDGMVTAPLSKTGIRKAGLRDMGHTDILKRVAGVSAVHMGFAGRSFSVVLATAHIPLAEVSMKLTPKGLCDALLAADELRSYLPSGRRKKPLGVLGLNPHAGEEGLIGNEEIRLWPAVQEFARKVKIPLVGPLVPDAAFLQQNWKRYSVFLALYHDQGLIPFKCVHGQQSGVHISLGLPFVRTSVDHGTARDIFGLDKANPNSMIDAVRWGVRLSSERKRRGFI